MGKTHSSSNMRRLWTASMPASGASPMVAVAAVAWVRKDKDALKEARQERGKGRGGRAKEEERKRRDFGEEKEEANERESGRAEEVFKSRDIWSLHMPMILSAKLLFNVCLGDIFKYFINFFIILLFITIVFRFIFLTF